MKHDDLSWHLTDDWPPDVPEERAGTHIGMFLHWAVLRGHAGSELCDVAGDKCVEVRCGTLNGLQLLVKFCDGKLTSGDLDEVGDAFAEDYYERYLDDYRGTFPQAGELQWIARAEDFLLMATVLDERFSEWQEVE